MKKKHILKLSILLLLFVSTISFAQTAAQALAQNGLVKATANDREGAIVDYTRSIQFDPNPDVYYKRAIAYYQTNQFVKSLADYNKAADAKKGDAEFFFLRANCQTALNDYKSALADLDKAIALSPQTGRYYFFRGVAKVSLKDKNGACVDLHKAIDLRYDKALETLNNNCQ